MPSGHGFKRSGRTSSSSRGSTCREDVSVGVSDAPRSATCPPIWRSGTHRLTASRKCFGQKAQGSGTEAVEGQEFGLGPIGDVFEARGADGGECAGRRCTDLRKVDI